MTSSSFARFGSGAAAHDAAHRPDVLVRPRCAVAALAMLLGVGVMALLLFVPERLAAPSARLGVMAFNTALSISLLAAAAMCLNSGKTVLRRLGVAAGAIVALVAAATLLEHAQYAPFLIDNPALHRLLDPRSPAPGRMGAGVSVVLLLLGVASILWPYAGRRRVGVTVQVLVLGAMLTALLGLMVRALDVQFLYSPAFSQMPVHTGLALLAIGSSFWLAWHHAPWNTLFPFASDEQRLLSAGVLLLLGAAITAVAIAIYVYDGALERTILQQQQEVLAGRTALVQATLDYGTASVKAVAVTWAADIAPLLRASDRAATTRLNSIAASGVAAGMSAVAFFNARDEQVAGTGELVESPGWIVIREKPERTMLLWDAGVYLRSQIPIRSGLDTVGSMVAEQYLPALTEALFTQQAGDAPGVLEVCGVHMRIALCLPTRLGGFMRVYPSETAESVYPIYRALEGRRGQAYAADPAGARVLTTYAPLGEYRLGIAVRAPEAELKAPVRRVLENFIPAMFALVLILVAVLRYLVHPLAVRLAAREQQLAMALAASRLASWDVDLATTRVHLSEQWNAMLGGEPVATTTTLDELDALIHPDDWPRVHEQIERVLKGATDAYEIEHRIRDHGGGWVWIQSKGEVISRSREGRVLRLAGTNANVSERKAAEEQLFFQASHDALTRLPNRRLFSDRLRQAMARSQRNLSGMAVLYLDLDKFKEINDGFGHAAGDQLLQEFGQRLVRCVRATDTVARLGGDEFAIVLDPLQNPADSGATAEKILSAMAQAFVLTDASVSVTTSIGIATYSGDEETDEAGLLKRADDALYEAKRAGRKTYRYA